MLGENGFLHRKATMFLDRLKEPAALRNEASIKTPKKREANSRGLAKCSEGWFDWA